VFKKSVSYNNQYGRRVFKKHVSYNNQHGRHVFKKRVSYNNQYGRRVFIKRVSYDLHNTRRGSVFCVSDTNHWRHFLDNIEDAVTRVSYVVYKRLLLTRFGDAVYTHLLSCVL